jgi:hypothetical protein
MKHFCQVSHEFGKFWIEIQKARSEIGLLVVPMSVGSIDVQVCANCQ